MNTEITNSAKATEDKAQYDSSAKRLLAQKSILAHILVYTIDDDVVDGYAKEVTEHTGFPAYAPYSGDEFDLLTGEQVAEGSREKIYKTKGGKIRAASNVFARLVAAGQRLMAVIQKCEGMANKDLAKFADQINSLSDKWDR